MKKRNSLCLARKSAQNPGFLLIIITGWGESGKVILQVSIAFFRELCKKILGKDGSAPPPLEKNGLYAYALEMCFSTLPFNSTNHI